MATESPIRMFEACGKWRSHKGAASVSSAAKMALDEEALLVDGHKYPREMGILPNRSGSAPPNMGGSFAAIGNLMQNSVFSANLRSLSYEWESRGPGGQFVSHLSPDMNCYSAIGINSQFHQYVTSGFDQQIALNNAGNQLKFTSFRGSSDNFIHLSRGFLPTHKEEFEDDWSP